LNGTSSELAARLVFVARFGVEGSAVALGFFARLEVDDFGLFVARHPFGLKVGALVEVAAAGRAKAFEA
jgi:hypothetical protein